jgi:hypothetical protein
VLRRAPVAIRIFTKSSQIPVIAAFQNYAVDSQP